MASGLKSGAGRYEIGTGITRINYMDMQKTIGELESVNYELDKNKNMLVEAERYSALGQMSAQMVHNFLSGGAAINVLARQMGAEVRIVDLGVASDLGGSSKLNCEEAGMGDKKFFPWAGDVPGRSHSIGRNRY